MYFSVVIPVYNVEKYLEDCINSILTQTFSSYEIILVDDGSTDRSGEICDKFSKEYPNIIVIHKNNSGAAASRNIGVEKASGKYIVFLDSDDYIAETTFFEDVHKASENDQDIVLFKYKKLYEATNKISEVSFNIPVITKDDSVGDILHRLVKDDAFYCAPWMKIIKSSVIKENGIVFKDGIRSEDQEWYYHVVLHAKSYASLNKAYIVYRQREGSVTSAVSGQHLMDNISLLDYWGKELTRADLEENVREPLLASLGKLYANLMVAYASMPKESSSEYTDDMKQLAWLLDYHLNPRTQKLNLLYRVLGFAGTISLLRVAYKIKQR